MSSLRVRRISQAGRFVVPAYREKAHRNAELERPHPLPLAARLGEESLAFGVHPGLTSPPGTRLAEAL